MTFQKVLFKIKKKRPGGRPVFPFQGNYQKAKFDALQNYVCYDFYSIFLEYFSKNYYFSLKKFLKNKIQNWKTIFFFEYLVSYGRFEKNLHECNHIFCVATRPKIKGKSNRSTILIYLKKITRTLSSER